MKISLHWLSEYVQWREDNPAKIAAALTEAVGEVDDCETQGEFLENVVIGEILSLTKHPNADKLSLCTVMTDAGEKRVVCGGTNLRVGMHIAFAHIGARVKWHGGEIVTLAPVKIRGEASEGMICAAEELELEGMFVTPPESGERPILDLSHIKGKIGAPLKISLGLTDTIFHIDNHAITNRPDLFSHIGFARELVALGLAVWRDGSAPAYELPKLPKKALATPPTLQNESGKLCPHYFALAIELDACLPTPEWMVRRLQAVGVRSINLAVDITNYVMLEVGSPLHSFDIDDFKGPLTLRLSKKGETVTTLDGKQYSIPESVLVNGDADGIFDLVGIMGGERTSTKHATKRLLFQAAVFEPKTIRRAVVQLGKRTDAATIYEKGVPCSIAKMGLARAVSLLLEHSKGMRITSPLLGWGHEEEKVNTITIDATMFPRLLGIPCTGGDAITMLTSVGCTCKKIKESIHVSVPVWRGDLTQKSDLVEEVARLIGFNNIPASMPIASIQPPKRDTRLQSLRLHAKERGFIELLELSLVSPALLKKFGWDSKDTFSIENPLGEELSLLRPHLLPAIVQTVAREVKNVQSGALRCLEHGHVVMHGKEVHQICFVVASTKKPTLKEEPFLEIGTSLCALLQNIGHTANIVKSVNVPTTPYIHPSRYAEIMIGTTVVGSIYELHPALVQSFDFPGRVGIAELDWSAILAISPMTNLVTPIPKFPAITYDETLPLTSKFDWSALQKKRSSLDPLLTNVEIVDLYEGPNGKTVTLRCTYRSEKDTLTETQAESAHKKFLTLLQSYKE